MCFFWDNAARTAKTRKPSPPQNMVFVTKQNNCCEFLVLVSPTMLSHDKCLHQAVSIIEYSLVPFYPSNYEIQFFLVPRGPSSNKKSHPFNTLTIHESQKNNSPRLPYTVRGCGLGKRSDFLSLLPSHQQCPQK